MTWKALGVSNKRYFSGVKRAKARMKWIEVGTEGKETGESE